MYVLHYAPDNASLIIRLALIEAGQGFTTALVNRRTRMQDSAAYRALNPAGLIPVLETDEGPISETAAILLWLADRHGAGLAPNGPRGAFLKWLFFLSNTAHADLRQLFYQDQYVTEAGKAGHYDRLSARMVQHFTILNDAAATPALFAAPSVLGLYTAALLRWSVLYPRPNDWFNLAHYPALQAMAKVLEARPSVAALIQAEGLGDRPFTAPQPCTPPEGAAL